MNKNKHTLSTWLSIHKIKATQNAIDIALMEYITYVEKQRDELLAELEKITDVFANIGITSGLYDDELDALKSACDVIASVKESKQ